MNWNQCDLIECVPDKRSGAPVLRGTRIPPEAIVSNYEAGSTVEEIVEDYPTITHETVTRILAYAAASQLKAAS